MQVLNHGNGERHRHHPTVLTGAAAGTYSMVVSQIATSQSLSSGAFSLTPTRRPLAGTLAVSILLQVDKCLISPRRTRRAERHRFRDQQPGRELRCRRSASVVTGSNGSHLVLSSTATGASNVIDVSVSNLSTDNGLSSLGVTSTAGNHTGTLSSFTSAGRHCLDPEYVRAGCRVPLSMALPPPAPPTRSQQRCPA